MATSNIAITTTWTQLAATADDPVMVTWQNGAFVEFAATAADTAPTVTGHLLKPGDVLTRTAFGAGYIWARCKGGFDKATMVVNK